MSPRIPTSQRRVRLVVLLLLALVPLTGPTHGAPSAAETRRAAPTPRVLMKLAKDTVTTKQRAKARIALHLRGTRTQEQRGQRPPGLGTGRVRVAVKGEGRTKRVGAKLVAGKAVVRLPRLSRGTYKVRATFLGNAHLGKARSRARTLVVVRPGSVGASGCASASAYTPDGPDGRGGCFPGLSNTGPNAPAGSMATYTGPCTITTANVVIDSKVVNCRTLVVASGGGGLVLKNSYLNGGIVQSGGAAAFTVQDSLVDSGVQYPACSDGSCPAGKYACGDTQNATTDCGVTGSNFKILRTEIINSNRAAYCESSCLIQDSYFHGTTLWPDASNQVHASSVREEQNLTLLHSSLHCSYTGPFVNGEIGCSADLTGYADFAPIRNNTVDGNLFLASPGSSFCAYGGATTGKPFSGDPTNGTNQKFTDNVFQRGANRKCGAYGPVTNFNASGSGNVWSGNVWDDGKPVAPAN